MNMPDPEATCSGAPLGIQTASSRAIRICSQATAYRRDLVKIKMLEMARTLAQ
jgi:hypothetical protein